MRITEITQPKISKVAGNSVTIDQGNGVTTTVDTKKNPNALNKDPKTGKVGVQKPQNSAMKKNTKTTIKPGDKVDPETLGAN